MGSGGMGSGALALASMNLAVLQILAWLAVLAFGVQPEPWYFGRRLRRWRGGVLL